MTLLRQVVSLVQQSECPLARAEAGTITIGVFFFLRPGKYIGRPNDATDSLFCIRRGMVPSSVLAKTT